ncbi:MAG: ANTAR domain-containing protein [Clostridia bacterium]|nr:ANTAR domain-containing protein [Clostridia bacterium]
MREEYGCRLVIAAPQPVAEKLRALFAQAGMAPQAVCHTGEEAVLAVGDEGALLLTTWRLPDMSGGELARRIGQASDVLMIVPQGFEGESGLNVVTLQNPVSQEALVQSVRVMEHCRTRMGELRECATELRRRLEERKIVEQAKGRLMERLGLSEAEAHHRMQKQSMDSGRRLIDVAQEILSAAQMAG